MSGKKTIFSILVSIIVIVAAIFAYRFFFPEPSMESINPGLVSSGLTDIKNLSPGDEFLKILLSLKGLEFKTEVFEILRASQLRDFTTQLKPQIPGVPNPFAPFGSPARLGLAGAVSSTSTSTATSTRR